VVQQPKQPSHSRAATLGGFWCIVEPAESLRTSLRPSLLVRETAGRAPEGTKAGVGGVKWKKRGVSAFLSHAPARGVDEDPLCPRETEPGLTAAWVVMSDCCCPSGLMIVTFCPAVGKT